MKDEGRQRVQFFMPRIKSVAGTSVRFFAVLVGLLLLALLVIRTGPQVIWQQLHKVGLGLALIIVVGGLGYFIRTWVWRLTFACDITALSWSRSFAVCLVSEALGQLGFGGKALGEGIRIALLRPAVPLANAISSVAIDGGLHLATSAIVMLSGIIATLLLASLSGTWRVFALIFAAALIALLIFAIVAYGNRWELMGNTARTIAHVPSFNKWINGKLPVIDSSERNLLNFFRKAPVAFCGAFLLSFLWQALAILEVYIILRFMGARITVLGAFVMEGLTKLINLVGALSPGNIGTYEGGNMLITKLFGVSATIGLTLALCRRARVLFWALIGGICLMLMGTRNPRNDEKNMRSDSTPGLVPLTVGEETERGTQCSEHLRSSAYACAPVSD